MLLLIDDSTVVFRLSKFVFSFLTADDPYISSDEEEELNDEGIMDGLLKSFKSSLSGGGDSELGSTQDYLMNSLKSKANVCLICIETIKKNDPVSA